MKQKHTPSSIKVPPITSTLFYRTIFPMAHNQTHVTVISRTMILAIIIATLCGCGMGQSSSWCTNVIISMSPCLNYITGNSSTPSSGCCTQLASVVKSQPQCLCEVLNGGGSSLGLNTNQTQALELPKACNVQMPPTSQCNAASPGSSPTRPASSTPNSGRESNTVPSTGDGSSDAFSTRLALIPLMFSLLVASYAIGL